MSLHDAYARFTPFEVAFPQGEAIDRLVGEIDQEAGSRAVDASLPDVFLTLGAVDDFVRGLQPPGASESAMAQYGALVFHASHFVRAARPVFLVTTEATRGLVDRAPGGEPAPPAPAGYLQLPQHLLWMDAPDGGTPESLDGLFWVASLEGMLHVLPVTGVLPDGPGFRAFPLPAAPVADAGSWLEAEMRGDDEDFSSSLPGQELDGLYAVRTAGEILKLLARFFALVSGAADSRDPPATHARSSETDGPRPSGLPFVRVGQVA